MELINLTLYEHSVGHLKAEDGLQDLVMKIVVSRTIPESKFLSGSGPRKNLLIALDRFGHSRKLKVHTHNFGKRINYARALTMTAPPKQMAALRAYIEDTLQNQDKIRHVRNVRHEFSLQQKFCATLIGLESYIRDNSKCKKQEKRRKKKRAPSGCKGSERRGVFCGNWSGSLDSLDSGEVSLTSKTSCEDATSNVLCKKQLRNVSSKKRKSRIKVSKGDEKSQPRRKHMIQEVIKKPILVEALKDFKKSPGIIKQQKMPEQKRTSSNPREKLTEKTSRTTLPPRRNSDVSLPAIYSMPTSSSTWENSRIHKSSTYLKNAVTTAAKPGIMNKPQFSSGISLESNSSLLSSPFEVSEDIMNSATSSDSSIEDSEESIYSEDNESTSSIDCVTLMTTMDTTPPERTEDYMKATTQSTLNAFDAKFIHFINPSNYTPTVEDKTLH
ncbi:hypothetical protein PV326_009310 [Microctonus aethiopoides]|nr:hypothetical protein PV326_009310 [Microctonus aethiopoides]